MRKCGYDAPQVPESVPPSFFIPPLPSSSSLPAAESQVFEKCNFIPLPFLSPPRNSRYIQYSGNKWSGRRKGVVSVV